MEEWDDTVPEWIHSDGLTEFEALKELMGAAEVMSSRSIYAFEGYPGPSETDGEIEVQTIHLKEFENIDLRVCWVKGKLHTMALCHRNRDTPQIILRAPTVFGFQSDEK